MNKALIIYLIGYLAFYTISMRYLSKSFLDDDGKVDSGIFIIGFFMTLFSLFWPLLTIVFIIKETIE